MKKIITRIINTALFIVIILLNVQILLAQQKTYKYNNNIGKEGYSIAQQGAKGIRVNFSITQFSTIENIINGKMANNISLFGMLLPNEAGYPDLPSNGRYIAIPQGSKAILKIVSYTIDSTVKSIDIAPAPVIPFGNDDTPLIYKQRSDVYSQNAFYPATPVVLSEPTQIRGVDVVMLGIMPFQYNPVTKELLVYKDIQIEISFEGGNGRFGENVFRSRWWDPILEDMIINHDQLPAIDYNEIAQKAADSRATGCEYAIITPNGPDFSQWADSIKKFRTEQGILTNIYKLSDIGSTTATGIKAWVKNAYTTWSIKPAAMLILGDYGTDANSTVISDITPSYASDNMYADVTGDNLPDITFSRIVANNAAQLKILCSKFLNYERNPPTDVSFYDRPLTAGGWQDERWFQLGAEVVAGFWKTFKNPTRINAIGSPGINTGNNVPNTGIWSTASNTAAIVKYFGQSGLKYIPDQPGTLGGFSGGNASAIVSAINKGTFLVYHRDHGYVTGWGTPSFSSTNISSLTNVDNKLPFVFSINCLTGKYQNTTDCFGEKFIRHTYNGQNSGALGFVAPSEISLSFYNDTYMWGIVDNMWPNFMPFGTNPVSRDMRPAFASTAGRYFLAQSSWVSGSSGKKTTYNLYHTFADAFQWFYSEVPKNLTIAHNQSVPTSTTTFEVTADVGSFIALTVSSPTGPIILGTATGTGFPASIALAQSPTTNMLITVTKQNYFRYSKTVLLLPTSVHNIFSNNLFLNCYPNPFNQSTAISYQLEKAGSVTLSVFDMLGKKVVVIVDNVIESSGAHQVQFNGKDLPKGVYSCVLKTDSQVVTKNIVIKD